ncbi:hypothetical protein BCR34DRAFT_597707 [Clohesyomyces aquaticus]|uniref:Uncharacterized protein n=1 Tax=Clohesyomyces aquaticus TaxID=1231657 RepID=A0A1Y2A1P6_9PLEO|nr:hypothetical protein BCR34DRAFT_597707 [Clohesyomyces aquaticus]
MLEEVKQVENAKSQPDRNRGRASARPVSRGLAAQTRGRTRSIHNPTSIFDSDIDTLFDEVVISAYQRGRSQSPEKERPGDERYRVRDYKKGPNSKKRGRWKGSGAVDASLEHLMEQLNDIRVGLPEEDDVTRAIREIFKRLLIDKNKP